VSSALRASVNAMRRAYVRPLIGRRPPAANRRAALLPGVHLLRLDTDNLTSLT
jgi:hypothetical protein